MNYLPGFKMPVEYERMLKSIGDYCRDKDKKDESDKKVLRDIRDELVKIRKGIDKLLKTS